MYINRAAQIRSRVKMQDVLSMCGIETGRNRLPCPLHRGRNNNFQVWDESFYCFKCGAHGDVIDFVMQYYSTDFKTACRLIDEKFVLNLYKKPTLTKARKQQAQIERKRREQAEEAECLQHSKWAYHLLCCYRLWLLRQKPTDEIIFDIVNLERLLDLYADSGMLIEWDAAVLICALMKKHKNEVRTID